LSGRTVAIVQARMGSERLPGKVLLELAGRSVLEHVVRRAHGAGQIDDVVVATTAEVRDDAIVDECDRLEVRCHRGPENDVLRRFALTAEAESADLVVRITADCPLIAAAVIDDTVSVLRQQHADYASNTLRRTFPTGLDVECFTFAALQAANREALEDAEREHVTPFIYNRTDRFRAVASASDENHSRFRLTLDRQEDLVFFRGLEAHFPDAFHPDTSWQAVVASIQQSEVLLELQDHACAASIDPYRNAMLR